MKKKKYFLCTGIYKIANMDELNDREKVVINLEVLWLVIKNKI